MTTTIKGPLSFTERSILTNALRIAADMYRNDARMTADTPRIAEQFEKQAESADKWVELIEDASEVTIR